MKNFLIFILILSSTSLLAQKNAIKVGVVGISLGDFSMSYEREITSNTSINVNGGYWNLNSGMVNLDNYFEEGKGVWLQDVGTGWHASMDYRFYIGKSEAIKGFYFGPYLRYWQNGLTLADFIQNDNTDGLTFDIAADFSGVGLGAQIGCQWIIADRLSLDWYFIGVGAQRAVANISYVARNYNNFDYGFIEDDVKEVFSETPQFIQNNVEVTTGVDLLKIKIPVFVPDFRTGFTIGYAF